MNKFFKLLILVSPLLFVGGLCVKDASIVNSNTNLGVNESIPAANSGDWLTYTNREFGYQLQYPEILFSNYVSQENFPMVGIDIDSAPTRREEGSFVETRDELLADEATLQNAVVDNRTYILSTSGIKMATKISRAEGGSIVKKYYWYDHGSQYSFVFIFPSFGFSLQDFLQGYNTTEKVNTFMEQVGDGTAETKYQSQFDLFDIVMKTLTATASIVSEINDPDLLRYTSTQYGLSFDYPKDWIFTDPISDDIGGVGYIDPPNYTDSWHLLSIEIENSSYQDLLDREPSEWRVLKRTEIIVNGIKGTHEVGEAADLGSEDIQEYTYNSYFFPFNDSKSITFFLADNDPDHMKIVEEMLSSVTW